MSFYTLKGKELTSVVECQLHIFQRKTLKPKESYHKNTFGLFVQDEVVVMTAFATKQKHLGQPIEEVEKEYKKEFYQEII